MNICSLQHFKKSSEVRPSLFGSYFMTGRLIPLSLCFSSWMLMPCGYGQLRIKLSTWKINKQIKTWHVGPNSKSKCKSIPYLSQKIHFRHKIRCNAISLSDSKFWDITSAQLSIQSFRSNPKTIPSSKKVKTILNS